MKYFLDCGCNDGDTIEKFLKGEIFSHIPDPQEYYIIGFDICEDFRESVLRTIHLNGATGYFVHAAVTTHARGVEAMMAKDNSVSSSIIPENNKAAKWFFDHNESVPSIDFSGFITTLDHPEILLKMDIEGSEYDVLPKMVRERTIFSVKELMIEYHYSFRQIDGKLIRKWYRDYKDFLTKYFEEIGILVQEYK